LIERILKLEAGVPACRPSILFQKVIRDFSTSLDMTKEKSAFFNLVARLRVPDIA